MKGMSPMLASVLCGVALWFGLSVGSNADSYIDVAVKSLAERTGSTFMPVPDDPYRSPRLKIIELPDFSGADAIWGSTGRDRRGHIWIGVSADGGEHSAHLFEYDPVQDTVTDRGDVISNLKSAGLYKEGERQIKIHSRIVPADDGYLYFSSTDQEGERGDGSLPPKWGSHLWRLHPEESRWEHLHWVQEGLTATVGGGRWVYTLGLWGHVLYQYDTQTGALSKVTVGSVSGHMSRNFIADLRGHVFVPRLNDAGVTLVEFNSNLEEIATTPLNNYLGSGKPRKNHGIVGLVYLDDGSMVISTHVGYLYRITPQSAGPSRVDALGPFDPVAPGYAPSLFTFAGERYLVGVARKKKTSRGDMRRHVWLVYDLQSGRSQRVDFAFDGKALIYGSITRDLAGRFYVAGRRRQAEGEQLEPLLIQIDTRD
jgi:hypothetical protein